MFIPSSFPIPAARTRPPRGLALTAGFTLIELLVATVVFAALMFVCLSVTGQVSGVWRRGSAQMEAFQGARLGFDIVTRALSQATLNSYLDYDDANNPSRYIRQSNLQFICGPAGVSGMPGTSGTGSSVFFQAPAAYTETTDNRGLAGALNVCGFYVSYGNRSSWVPDSPSLPDFSSSGDSYRYRLMQLLVPVEQNIIYECTKATSGRSTTAWFDDFLATHSRPIADNIIALVVRPVDPGGSTALNSYSYDSKANAAAAVQPATANQLPPVVEVTLIALDEDSLRRVTFGVSPPSAIASALAGKFLDPSSYDQDLADIESALTSADLNYRIFSTAVPIRESKWTK